MSARDRILGRIRTAIEGRERVEHPGPFEGWRPVEPDAPGDLLRDMFQRAGGEVVRVSGPEEARAWLADFATGFESVSIGRGVPTSLTPDRPVAEAASAALAVSMARGAVAETGSLLMDARDGRRTQLLAPTHVVIVEAGSVHATLRDALGAIRDDLPSALGLHSGPSKSADIGQVMVRGVHGPGRVVALLM